MGHHRPFPRQVGIVAQADVARALPDRKAPMVVTGGLDGSFGLAWLLLRVPALHRVL